MRTLTKDLQANITPTSAIEILRHGNERFVDSKMHKRDLLAQVNQTADGQFPFAFILSCIDSRVPAELVFDQGVGDIFSCRVAGNIVNNDILGSMEFACKLAGTKAIVVLGHTKCGAVKGACDGAEMGNLTGLLQKIRPAVEAENTVTANRTSSNEDFVNRVADLNIHNAIAQIQDRSDVLREMLQSGEISLIGALYDVETGEVTMYEDTLVCVENCEPDAANKA